MIAQSEGRLKKHLDRLVDRFDARALDRDPLVIVHEYPDPRDAELVGLVGSSLAYGRVDTILTNVRTALAPFGPHPMAAVLASDPARDRRRLSRFRHRFNDGDDVACLLHFVRQMVEQAGSIGGFFAAQDPGGATIEAAASAFCESALRLDSRPIYRQRSLPKGAGVRFFLPSPTGGSACKRLNLYLRWMVRPADGLDLGLWPAVSPRRLVMPLDTHVARISRYLGLSQRRSVDWRMALEVTESLRRLDPEDPIRYDYAICRLGVLSHCPTKYDARSCHACDLQAVCTL